MPILSLDRQNLRIVCSCNGYSVGIHYTNRKWTDIIYIALPIHSAVSTHSHKRSSSYLSVSHPPPKDGWSSEVNWSKASQSMQNITIQKRNKNYPLLILSWKYLYKKMKCGI